jgi:thioester reductase-like protein
MNIDAILQRFSDRSGAAMDEYRVMRNDSRLPSDLTPSTKGAAETPGYVLLTGATGFLGGYLLRSLLTGTNARVCCLVRPNGSARNRVRANLELYGIWDSSYESRIDVICGELGEPYAGLSAENYKKLARSVDAIYHCAASVNWIYPYRKLSKSNVHGALELLRFACSEKIKTFHFVSSCSVAYSCNGPQIVDESTEMLPYIEGIHLVYAQTKCVAESLVRNAGRRGLPVTIYRPAMISGDSQTGRANPNDFLSLFIKGCIEMGSAPELEWLIDCCPVDFAAESIVRLSKYAGPESVFHLINPVRRYWHECILWINLFGYPVRLIPYQEWLSELRKASESRISSLRQLAPFFCRPVPGQSGVFLPQLYEESRRNELSTARTQRILEKIGASCAPLNADLLDRYFESFLATGFLPQPHNRFCAPQRQSLHLDLEHVSSALGRKVRKIHSLQRKMVDSIITELTSWRFKTTSGLFPCLIELESGEMLKVMIKLKARDSEVLEVGEAIARLCSKRLGDAYSKFRDSVEFVRCHLREPAIYRQNDTRFRKCTPGLYGHAGNTLILEFLDNVLLKDTADDISGWRNPCITAALEGLASVHAVWFGRESDLLCDPSIGPTLITGDSEKMTPFWMALAENARPLFEEWLGSGIWQIQEDSILGIGEATRISAQLPGTLIHNDFNPRNIALRSLNGGLRLCAYDWEMARLGLPQHDLAEMLCFVLSCDIAKPEVDSFLEFNREALERASGKRIPANEWILGFRLSLADLLINRFAMYAMVHRFQRQSFLERVIRSWHHLYRMYY